MDMGAEADMVAYHMVFICCPASREVDCWLAGEKGGYLFYNRFFNPYKLFYNNKTVCMGNARSFQVNPHTKDFGVGVKRITMPLCIDEFESCWK